MEDRLNEVLNDIIKATSNSKVKKVLKAVLEISDEISYMDYNDYYDFTADDEYTDYIQENSKYLEDIIR